MFGRPTASERINAAVMDAVSQTRLDNHLADCLEYRRQTKEKMDELACKLDEINAQFDDIASQRELQHKENLDSLKWQRRLLISILFAMLGFLGEQIWFRIFT